MYDKPLPPPPEPKQIKSKFLTDERVEKYLNSSNPITTDKLYIALLFRIAKALENNQKVKFL